MLDCERYIKFLKDNKLTQAQFLFLLLVYKKKWKLIEEYKKIFPSEDGSMIGKQMREDLVRQGFFKRVNPDSDKADNYTITEKFSNIFADEYEVGNQIWDLYPKDITSGGKTYPLKLMDKNELRKEYYNRIKGNYEEHLEVLEDLKYAIENNLIKGKIENFVKSEAWTDIRKERIVIKVEHKDDL